MNKITVSGLDLAKNVSQLHGVNADGKVVVHKQLGLSQMHEYIANFDPCLIGIEACDEQHFWSRELTLLGHTVRMKAPV